MKRALLLSLCFACSLVRAEFPPDDVSSAIDPDAPDQEEVDRDNPFAAQPEELQEQRSRRLQPRTRSPVEAEPVPEEPRRSKKRRPARAERDVDSEEPSDEVRELVDVKRDRVIARIGIYAGMNLLSSGNSDVTDQRSQQGLTTNFPVGLNLQAHGFRYFGLELDGYMSIKPSQNVFDSASASTAPSTKTINVMGGDAILKAIYPFDRRAFRWYPQVGVGYGYHNLKTTSSTNGATEEYNLTANGFLAYAGIEMVPTPTTRILVDGSMSLLAGGRLAYQPSGGTPSDAGDAGKFLRLRLAGYFDVSKHVSLGLALMYRSIQVDNLTGPTGTTTPTAGAANIGPAVDTPENQVQVLASMTYLF